MSKRKQEPAPAEAEAPRTKIATLLSLLRREEGADVQMLVAATGWRQHSVRGAIAGHIKKKLGLTITTERLDGRTLYRIVGK
jgi:hypothetical protein